MPGAGDALAWDRYTYVKYNPIKYMDPSGHRFMYDQNGAYLESHTGTVQYYNLMMGNAFNLSFQGEWSLQEMKQIFKISWRISNLMGGTNIFKLQYGDQTWSFNHYVSIDRSVGLTRSNGNIVLTSGFSDWTLAHELGHALNFANNRAYENGLQEAVGAGKGEWWKVVLRDIYPDIEGLWYDPGSSPPAFGIDANFNASEDFAESFAAVVLTERALAKNIKDWRDTKYSWSKEYQHFYNTPRGRYVLSILRP